MPGARADDWWDDAWPYRVRISCKPGEGDVAFAQVTLAGRTTPDGRDLRLVDAKGGLRAFEIIHHDPHLATLIQFQAPTDQPLTTFLYYGNRAAAGIKTSNPLFTSYQEQFKAWKQVQSERNAALSKRKPLEEELERTQKALHDAETAGQAGPQVENLRKKIETLQKDIAALAVPEAVPEPKTPAAWYPHRGVLLRVYRKAKPGHPKDLPELRKQIGQGTLEGAGFRPGISDGFNPFGTSQDYMSVYEGYLKIDQPGEYGFCTVSDDGSWVLMNDKPVVAWPGEHGIGGAERGEKNGKLTLKAEVVHVQYFHEQGTGTQMAFLGWKPPGADHFVGVPEAQWLSVRRAGAGPYEAHEHPVVAVADANIVSTYWIRDSESKQVTMVGLADRSHSSKGEIKDWRWTFGDGLEGAGKEVSHAYFRLGRPEITLTVTDAAGNRDSTTFAPYLFQVDAVGRSRKYGEAPEYVQAAADYDPEKLARDDLALYVEFCGNLEQWPQHVRAGRAYVRRFADAPDLARIAAATAESCLQPESYDSRAADELLRRALEKTEAARDRYNLLLRRAHVLAWHLDQPEPAQKIYQELLAAAGAQTGKYFETLRRACLLGQADAALVTGDFKQAESLYRQAGDMAGKKIEQAEMLAKTGSYGYTVDDLLARGEYAWAREALDKWEDEFPIQKLEGLTFFLRGKVLFVEHPSELALRYLDLAQRVAPRAVHVPEAVWLRANCDMALNRNEDALIELSRITTEFTYSEFREQAAKKIAECKAKLGTSATQPDAGHTNAAASKPAPKETKAAADTGKATRREGKK